MRGYSRCNVLSFSLQVDLIVNDKAGFFWLVNFGYTLIKLVGEGWRGLDMNLVNIQGLQTRHKIV